MRLPGRLQRFAEVFFRGPLAEEETAAAIQARLDAEQAAREAHVIELRHGCAIRLRPYIGRLFIATNFQGRELADRAADVAEGIVSASQFSPEIPIGISVILTNRRYEQYTSQHETAEAIATSLRGKGFRELLTIDEERQHEDMWRLGLARAAESTTMETGKPADEVGHIAVVSALDLKHGDLDFMIPPLPGAVFQLKAISDEARFTWQTVSRNPLESWILPGEQH